MQQYLPKDWQTILEPEFHKPYFQKLKAFLEIEYAQSEIFPPINAVFTAFEKTPLSEVKVLLLGQDPYHDNGQAHGLSFSVQNGVKVPPSLVNIYKELESDLGIAPASHGCLTSWAEQGVLLLNTVLTVRAHEANSHQKKGWETFTDAVIDALNALDQPIVFFLWGKPAQSKKSRLTNPKHLILEAPHPSPLSAYRGFFGSKPFSQANAFLTANGVSPINWQL